ncbi:hypothetical protein NEOLEDRAFT_1139272 [Neolentinus lepideus HHB14362 ss-1]|uniref:Uncharacterized protein n=1 Tax=Neolentinus lepideus HHB14362 ss-1 TaxID=1314782 RepID=A0A165PSY3_9AGAM|nr:hypothetical protein NEOLEDRAFT_1139272 [Neolentinus lepideus HHB14362 ss-1]
MNSDRHQITNLSNETENQSKSLFKFQFSYPVDIARLVGMSLPNGQLWQPNISCWPSQDTDMDVDEEL